MTKKESNKLDDMFGPSNGFGQAPFGGSFGSTSGFGQAPFGAGYGFGQSPAFGAFSGGSAKEIIDNYEKEVNKADSDTRDDLVSIDIELGKMSSFHNFGTEYSRLKVKEHITNITKRYREAILTLSAVTCALGTALVIEKIRNKK